MGKFDKLAKFLGLAVDKYGDDAAKLLEKIDSPELATSLKGAERGDYLKALDEVYGDQTKRMTDMGFGPETYYHGSKFDVPSFNLENVGKSSGMKESGKAVWLTSKPEVSEQYTHNFPFDEINPNISDLKIKGDFKVIDDLNRYSGKERGNINSFAKEQGKSGVIFKGIRDNIWEGPLAPGESDVVSVFEPKDIRSTRAAFDPRFKNSPLLMAGGLAAPMGKQAIDMNPLEDIKTGLGYYEKAKEAVSKPLAQQLNIGKNPQDEKFINEALKTGLDPVNFIPGAAGLGVGAIQMLTPSEEEMKMRVLDKMSRREGY